MKTQRSYGHNSSNLNFRLLEGDDLVHAESTFDEAAIPVKAHGFSLDERGTFPVLYLDLSDRPDVRDLYRVVEQEGGKGALRSKWSAICGPGGRGRVRLDVDHLRPAQCAQRIVFDLPEASELLLRIAMDGRVGIVPATHIGDELALIVDGGHRDLVEVLHLYAIAALTAWGELRP